MGNLKAKIKKKALTIGSWITIGHSSVAEIMAKAGFDWLTIDMEHSAITIREAEELIRVIELAGVAPLVRVGENSPNLIKRAMDAGAHGVIVPMVNTREDAIHAVRAVKYPPIGTRGVGLARAQGYGMGFERYRDWVNKDSIVIVQIEHIDAVRNIDKILEVEGVDGFIVGPYDLSGSMGRPGDFTNPDMKKVLIGLMAASKKHKAVSGLHVVAPDARQVEDAIKQGYRFIAYSLDTLFLGDHINKDMSRIRKMKKK